MTLFSCPVCFGQAGDPSVRSVLLGVGLLLGVVLTVLVAVGSVAMTWARRGRELAALENGSPREPEPQMGSQLSSAFPPPPPL
jgi:hypothetical protein